MTTATKVVDDGLDNWRDFTTRDRTGIEQTAAPPRVTFRDYASWRPLVGVEYPADTAWDAPLVCDRCGAADLDPVPCNSGAWIDDRCKRCGIWASFRDENGQRQKFFIGRTIRLADAVDEPVGWLIDLTLLLDADDLPAAPFRLDSCSVVVDRVKWLRALQADIRRGARGPRAKDGVLQEDLRRLWEMIRSVQEASTEAGK